MNRQDIAQLLVKEGHCVISTEGRYVFWNCHANHGIRRSALYDIATGTRCIKCKRKGRTPRQAILLLPGTRSGDLEVVGYLGVSEGHSRVRVRNVINGLEAVMITNDFKRQKTKLLNEVQLRKLLQKNGFNRKGHQNPKNATYTWADIRRQCVRLGFALLHDDQEDSNFITDSGSSGSWKFRCKCGSIFSPTLNNIMTGNTRSCGCVRSQPQADIAKWLQDIGIEIKQNARKIIAPLELDIYIPSKKVAIEYCGLYWHGELTCGAEARTKHLIKLRACEALGIRLITIFEDEWIQNEAKIKGFLVSVLRLASKRIGARSCKVQQIASSEARLFLDTNHLQGSANGETYALYNKQEIVAAAVFARPNASRARKDGLEVYELVRYCVSSEIAVAGGLERLLKAFRLAHPECRKLVSYSDNRWSIGNIYRRLGFVMETVGTPSYWYFPANTQGPRQHRYRWRKSAALKAFVGADSDTEWDIMKRNGYDRIWDCGAARWVLSF